MEDYSIVVIGGIVATALICGLMANRYVRPFAKTEVQGVKLEALVGPVVSLTVLLLAFTLVTVYGSFLRAQTSAAEETRKVDYQFEMAQLHHPSGG
jgi:cytochrome bd-type quinol oxidase subunit 2